MATAQRGKLNLDSAPSAQGLHIALVVSEWNNDITGGLRDGAIDTLIQIGIEPDHVIVHSVPGSFELIHGCKVAAESGQYDAVIAIGSVIRGETAHFEFVCSGVTQGIALLNVTGNIPVIFCLLTDDNREQSIARSGGSMGNKGSEAAVAAVKMCQP